MTSSDWWVRLVYEDPTPVPELRADHLSKLHISQARHLGQKHGRRFDRQVPLPVVTALHNECHGATWTSAPHPHVPHH